MNDNDYPDGYVPAYRNTYQPGEDVGKYAARLWRSHVAADFLIVELREQIRVLKEEKNGNA